MSPSMSFCWHDSYSCVCRLFSHPCLPICMESSRTAHRTLVSFKSTRAKTEPARLCTSALSFLQVQLHRRPSVHTHFLHVILLKRFVILRLNRLPYHCFPLFSANSQHCALKFGLHVNPFDHKTTPSSLGHLWLSTPGKSSFGLQTPLSHSQRLGQCPVRHHAETASPRLKYGQTVVVVVVAWLYVLRFFFRARWPLTTRQPNATKRQPFVEQRFGHTQYPPTRTSLTAKPRIYIYIYIYIYIRFCWTALALICDISLLPAHPLFFSTIHDKAFKERHFSFLFGT